MSKELCKTKSEIRKQIKQGKGKYKCKSCDEKAPKKKYLCKPEKIKH